MDKVEIAEFRAKRIDTYLKDEIPAVRICLKNNGDRSLDKVKVVVHFQDKEGNTIFEEDFHPVLVSEYSFSGNNKLLKSGYVRELEKDKYFRLESAPEEAIWVDPRRNWNRAVIKALDSLSRRCEKSKSVFRAKADYSIPYPGFYTDFHHRDRSRRATEWLHWEDGCPRRVCHCFRKPGVET